MKAKELIEQLQLLNPDKEVWIKVGRTRFKTVDDIDKIWTDEENIYIEHYCQYTGTHYEVIRQPKKDDIELLLDDLEEE